MRKLTMPKPCPFCGHEPRIIPWHGGPRTKRMVECSNEACHSGPYVIGNRRYIAVKRWNTRKGEKEKS